MQLCATLTLGVGINPADPVNPAEPIILDWFGLVLTKEKVNILKNRTEPVWFGSAVV